MTDEKMSAAWRAHDDADAEWMEVQRLAQISREGGAQELDDTVLPGWKRVLKAMSEKKRLDND